MNILNKVVLLIGVSFMAFSCQLGTPNLPESSINVTPRIISLSGFLTEVLVEIGHGESLVARDVTSTYPASVVESLPNLGHVTKLNAEAILALQPTMIFVEKSQVNQSEVFEQLKDAGIKMVVVPTSTNLNNSVNAAKVMQEFITIKKEKFQSLSQRIESDSLKLAANLNDFPTQPKILFIYARGAGHLMVAGKNTSASAIIEKAGGKNAIQSFENFRALTAEALVEAAPDVILMFKSGLASLDGKKGLEQIAGIAQTPAFQNNQIIAMDGHYLTAFGTRAAEAALELSNKIHQTIPSL